VQRRIPAEPGAVRIQADVQAVEAPLPGPLATRAVQKGRQIDARSLCPVSSVANGPSADLSPFLDGAGGEPAAPGVLARLNILVDADRAWLVL